MPPTQSPSNFAYLSASAILALSPLTLAQPATSPSDTSTQSLYLSGHGTDDATPWEFKCSAGLNSGKWSTLPVPSCWDTAGFGTLSYGRQREPQPHEQGQYRRPFTLPNDWDLHNHTVYLVFEGAMTDTTAFLNGQQTGPTHQGAYYRFKYDVTQLLKPDQNLLEVTVDKESANPSINNAERRADYWNYGGIFRPVHLDLTPKQHLDRVAINATADGQFSAGAYTTGITSATNIRVELQTLDGKPAAPAITQPLTPDKTTLTTTLAGPQLWTAETPNLYQAVFTLLDHDTPIHTLTQRFGFRTIEVRPNQGLFLNGNRIFLKGTDRHSFYPDTGRATSPALSRKDVLLMKEMNNNAVRMSHYPPDAHFLDTCDELGLYVLDELAGWHKSYDTPTAHRLVAEMVERDVNHPCILFWDNGNEGGWNTAVDYDFADLDPQHRTVLHPWAKFGPTNTKHYPDYPTLLSLVDGPEVFFPTEFQHALFDGGGAAALSDFWQVILHGKSSAGGIIWAYVDEAVKRPDTGKLDTAGNQAPDGVLGPYREKEASFYAIQQIWSPLQLTRDKDGHFTLTNNYDFLNANTATATWQLRALAKPDSPEVKPKILAGGTFRLPDIPPHASAPFSLNNAHVETPAVFDQHVLDAADVLAITLRDHANKELRTFTYPLRQTNLPPDPPPAHPETFTPSETPAQPTLTSPSTSLTLSKSTAQLLTYTHNHLTAPFNNGPRLAVGSAHLTSLTHAPKGDTYTITAKYEGNLHTLTYTLSPSGALTLDYTYDYTGPTDLLGVCFDMPDTAIKSMTWLGQGPNRVYKNRLEGNTYGVHTKPYNDTITGYADWIYPEFKGFHADVRWMQFTLPKGHLLLSLDQPNLYVQVLTPDLPAPVNPYSPTTAATRSSSASRSLSANAWAHYPDHAGLSILHAISPIGTKFHTPYQFGPQSQQTNARGDYHATVTFRLTD